MLFEYEKFVKDRTRFEQGFDSDARGGTAGADYAFTRWLTAGLALNFSRINGKFKADGGDFSTDTLGVILYGSVSPLANLFVDLTAGYNRKEYTTDRNIRFTFGTPVTLIQGVTKGDTHGSEIKAGINSGYDFRIANVTVGPRLGLQYSDLTIDGLRKGGRVNNQLETGLELVYDRQYQSSLRMNAGAFASMAISTPIGVLVPQTTIDYIHEFLDDQRTVFFRFIEDFGRTRLRFQTDPPDRDYGTISVGLAMVLAKGLTPFVNYRALVGYRDEYSHTVTGGLRFTF